MTHFYLTLLQSAKDIRYLELALEESEECLSVRNTHIAHVLVVYIEWFESRGFKELNKSSLNPKRPVTS